MDAGKAAYAVLAAAWAKRRPGKDQGRGKGV